MDFSRVNYAAIPAMLRERDQWVLWKNARGTKIPFQRGGATASSTNPETWASFDAITECEDECDGIGFVFLADGGLVGIDLDGCRDISTGEVAEWAKEIILKLGSYAEVSPSRTGVKIFALGDSPFGSGRKAQVSDCMIGGKVPAIEIYDRGRYFAVTGWRLKGAKEPIECDLGWLADKYFENQERAGSGRPVPGIRTEAGCSSVSAFFSTDAVMDRARAYLNRIEPAVSGSGGHNQTFKAACALVLGFGLDEGQAFKLLEEWNVWCQPPWSEKDLWHKIKSACKQDGERNYLRDVEPSKWDAVAPAETPMEVSSVSGRTTTLVSAMRLQAKKIRDGDDLLFDLGIPDLDRAIGGGVADGELVIIAARPSHGKSMVAMQICHHWTARGENVLVISEEMSALALGKRSLQFASEIPKHEWAYNLDGIDAAIDQYAANRGNAIVVESCGTIKNVARQVEKAIAEQQIRAVFVDYLQLLGGSSTRQSSCDRVSEVSLTLRRLATKHGIRIVALAQLNRDVEKRDKFIPKPSDLRDSGQIEQDADVILSLCWPWKLDASREKTEYLIFVCKNKNREILNGCVEVRFDPDRQRIERQRAEDMPNRESSFDQWNQREAMF